MQAVGGEGSFQTSLEIAKYLREKALCRVSKGLAAAAAGRRKTSAGDFYSFPHQKETEAH